MLLRVGEICDIGGHESVCAAINGRLKHHFVIRMPQLWTPLKVNLNGLDQSRQVFQKFIESSKRSATVS